MFLNIHVNVENMETLGMPGFKADDARLYTASLYALVNGIKVKGHSALFYNHHCNN